GNAVALAVRLRELISQWSAQTGIVATAELDEAAQLPVATAHALTRVLQESLANVYKHSAARQVRVSLRCVAQQVQLDVADDGHGFDLANVPSGLGLISMRERVAALGGELRIASCDHGTHVTVILE
ncbi:MAG: histidine kinase, partial [Oscillochloris sp.]|nr:histidine kinase [Oscillochloris sp.]